MGHENRYHSSNGIARVVIVDDHEIARSGLKSMLISEPDLRIVGEAADGREAVEMCHEIQPDLVLMDVQMPRMGGLAATRQIKDELPRIGVIIMTIYESPKYISEALKAGASGYVLKDATKHEVLGTVREVLAGTCPLNPEYAALQTRRLKERLQGPMMPPPEPMTPREVEILNLLAQGQTNREIAHRLVISVSTVKVHVEHIIAKLKVSDRTQAAVRAVTLGLIPDPRG